jgi:2-iminobutanoate/2-iminopropanoate deaminase
MTDHLNMLIGPCVAFLCVLATQTADAREIITGDSPYPQARAFSPAVITNGGRIVWLAGQTTLATEDGRSLVGDFEGQVRDIFARINKTLARAGGNLSDIVTMTVFITDVRTGTQFTEIRKEIFKEKFPASALITVSGLAQPGMMVEVQAVAVIDK